MEIKNEQQWKVAEVELVYKTKIKASERPKISRSTDVVQILRSCWNDSTIELFEEFKVLLLNRANRVLGICHLSKGGMAGTVVDPKLVFAYAIKAGASGIMIAHNHPSGNLTASQNDIDLTNRLNEGGKLLQIQLMDHIILTAEKYYSFADEGLI